MQLTVIIPVHNGGSLFQQCLKAIKDGNRQPDEWIVVSDGSTDGSDRLAGTCGVKVIRIEDGPLGPAAARNRGMTEATGDIFVFIDADVSVHTDTLSRIEASFTSLPEVHALFGSYDDDPPDRGVASLYKNLLHHYTHQQNAGRAVTFWAGCGAIRREVYERLGGFDAGYERPSIEDIAFGGRMVHAGYNVLLDPEIQVTHLKRWTLMRMLRSDVLDRAIPWTRLIAEKNNVPQTLNLDWRNRWSAVLAWAGFLFASGALFRPVLWPGAVLAASGVLALNFGLYRFFARKGGVAFAFAGFLLHGLYFLYSSSVFVVVMGIARLRARP